MGNIFYSILSGDMPFEHTKEKEAQTLVKDGKRPEIPGDVLKSEDVAIKAILSVIKRCWEQDPNDRPTASEVRDEFKKVMDGLSKPNYDKNDSGDRSE
jgi:serine/threonine protein kinase